MPKKREELVRTAITIPQSLKKMTQADENWSEVIGKFWPRGSKRKERRTWQKR
jgi:hypothetical protein